MYKPIRSKRWILEDASTCFNTSKYTKDVPNFNLEPINMASRFFSSPLRVGVNMKKMRSRGHQTQRCISKRFLTNQINIHVLGLNLFVEIHVQLITREILTTTGLRAFFSCWCGCVVCKLYVPYPNWAYDMSFCWRGWCWYLSIFRKNKGSSFSARYENFSVQLVDLRNRKEVSSGHHFLRLSKKNT